jgi:hypothetical protein
MGERVRVESVEALQKFRVALCKFAETVKVSLDEAEAEIQRTVFWLKQEQHNHWKGQIKKRSELCAQAKSALNRKKQQKTALGSRFSYVDEEKALAAAERRLEEARQKLANVRRWSRLLDEESFSYKGVAQGMSHAVEVDVPNALTQLDNMIDAIEAYASSAAPSEQRSTVSAPTSEDTAGPEQFASVARDTPAPPDIAEQAYRQLRTRTPSRAVRDEAPITELEARDLIVEEPAESVREALARLGLARMPIAADQKIVVARGAWQHPRIYLERLKHVAAGDSGWYVGFADDTEVSGYDAVRIADFLAGRRDLEAALELPAGCLVVLDRSSVKAVLDPAGTLL